MTGTCKYFRICGFLSYKGIFIHLEIFDTHSETGTKTLFVMDIFTHIPK